jgi:hypothetical protein
LNDKTFVARKKAVYENLQLALRWNRCDIAKEHILTGEQEFKSYQLMNLMETALLHNNHDFVKLFLENGLNLKTFLTKKRLYFLYNAHIVIFISLN